MAEAEDKKPGSQEERDEADNAAQPAPEETQERIQQLQQKLDEAGKSADVLKDQLLRKAAEFENYKRRAESDFANLIRNANEGLILSLLPIVDDLHRSLKQGRDGREEDAFFKGIELIYSKFSKALEQQGVVPFESVGKPFDVEYHDALLQMPNDTFPPHTVIEEVERGYKLNDRVLRHAKVVVSSGGTAAEPQGDDGKTRSKEAKKS